MREREDRSARSRHPSAARRENERETSEPHASARDARPRDPEGKLALFSARGARPGLGSLAIECSTCRRVTPVSPVRAALSALPPAIHLPVLRKYHSLMRCPACGRRTWVRLHWQL